MLWRFSDATLRGTLTQQRFLSLRSLHSTCSEAAFRWKAVFSSFFFYLFVFFFTRKSQSSVGILQARLLHVKQSCSAIWNILWEDKRLLRPEKKLRLCHTAPPSFLSFSGKVRIDGLEYRRRLAAETTPLPAPLSSVRGLCALGPCQTWERQATLREATFLKAVRKNNIGQGSPRCRARDI